jgi:pyridoxamine 5'-phosphate oxidase
MLIKIGGGTPAGKGTLRSFGGRRSPTMRGSRSSLGDSCSCSCRSCPSDCLSKRFAVSTEGAETPTPRQDLAPEAFGSDPFAAFARWMQEAEASSGMRYPNAMTLSTVTEDGTPDGRIVLLKGVDPRGFHFYTNYTSRKGRALSLNPRGALTFYWDLMGRQVRARGPVTRLPEAESDQYFESRPRDSRIGAWASVQSEVIESPRHALDARFEEASARFGPEGVVQRPPHWGGFVLSPIEIEFWQEVPYRLHDRFVFRREGPGDPWSLPVRLSP